MKVAGVEVTLLSAVNLGKTGEIKPRIRCIKILITQVKPMMYLLFLFTVLTTNDDR